MHHAAWMFVAAQVADCEPPFLEIGSLDINGSVREMFDGPYTGIDIVEGNGVDQIGDGATFTSKKKFGTVLCLEVLEHTPDARKIVANAHTLLRKGGRLVITAAGPTRQPHSATDGGQLRPDEFYRNVSTDDLAKWLKPFSSVDVCEQGDDVQAVAVK